MSICGGKGRASRLLTVSSDLLAADGVRVGVDTVVAREAVEQDVRRRGDVVGIGVGDTAGTQASYEERPKSVEEETKSASD